MRCESMKRKTKETEIEVTWNLDGSGRYEIDTGVGFFDHMLELFAAHGKFDLTVKCGGDIKVDGHHSVEDIGIVMGKLLVKTLGDKKGIRRYASALIPMDEALAQTALDISGRPFLAFNAEFKGKVGDFDLELIEEFFRAVCSYGMLTVHISILAGKNLHHMAEAVFKSFARALSSGVEIISDKIPSSKGMLE